MNYIIGLLLVSFCFCQNSITVNGGKLKIGVNMMDASTIRFELTLSSSSEWVGIGFGKDMDDHDMFYFSNN